MFGIYLGGKISSDDFEFEDLGISLLLQFIIRLQNEDQNLLLVLVV
jgi:hypothetical protein